MSARPPYLLTTTVPVLAVPMPLRRWLVGGTSLLLAASIAGCGADDGSGDASSGVTSAAADPAAFCEAAVDAEAALSVGSRGDLETTLTAVEDSAPEDVGDDVRTLSEKIREWLSTGDDTIFEQPEYTGASEATDDYMLAECGYERVEVTGVEHAYEGIPDTPPSGVVAIIFSNEGQGSHEISIVQINDDATQSLEQLVALPDDQIGQMIEFVGAAFAEPGESDTAFLRLEPGRYGAMSFTREGTTPEAEGSGPPHFTLGMFAEIAVPTGPRGQSTAAAARRPARGRRRRQRRRVRGPRAARPTGPVSPRSRGARPP